MSIDNLMNYIINNVGAEEVIRIIEDSYNHATYICPKCKGEVKKGDNFCMSCGIMLRWR